MGEAETSVPAKARTTALMPKVPAVKVHEAGSPAATRHQVAATREEETTMESICVHPAGGVGA
jgi:hypothetical protein